ncbi:MAG TPA: hypothetical protein V6D20_20005 [Candidatus Obscuribacterales bacterium]
MTLIPVVRGYRDLGLTGQFTAVWLTHTDYGLPLSIYLLRNDIGSLLCKVLDTAAIDGASHCRLSVLLGMEDFWVALVYLGVANEVAPVTVQLSCLVGSRGQDWHLLTAGAFVTMVVP